jgi:acyl carrier protein
VTVVLRKSVLCRIDAAIRRMGLHSDARITTETRFAEDLHLDKLDMSEFLLYIEEMFEATIPRKMIPEFNCINDLVDHLVEHLSSRTAWPALARAG